MIFFFRLRIYHHFTELFLEISTTCTGPKERENIVVSIRFFKTAPRILYPAH